MGGWAAGRKSSNLIWKGLDSIVTPYRKKVIKSLVSPAPDLPLDPQVTIM